MILLICLRLKGRFPAPATNQIRVPEKAIKTSWASFAKSRNSLAIARFPSFFHSSEISFIFFSQSTIAFLMRKAWAKVRPEIE